MISPDSSLVFREAGSTAMRSPGTWCAARQLTWATGDMRRFSATGSAAIRAELVAAARSMGRGHGLRRAPPRSYAGRPFSYAALWNEPLRGDREAYDAAVRRWLTTTSLRRLPRSESAPSYSDAGTERTVVEGSTSSDPRPDMPGTPASPFAAMDAPICRRRRLPRGPLPARRTGTTSTRASASRMAATASREFA